MLPGLWFLFQNKTLSKFIKIKRRIVRFLAKTFIFIFLETDLVPCPLCRKENNFHVIHQVDRYGINISVVKCSCGLVFENPIPTEKFISLFYRTPLFRALDWGVLQTSEKVTKEFGAEARAIKHVNLLEQVIKSNGGSIIDIGASEGTFLKIFAEKHPNFERYAIEPGGNFAHFIDHGVVSVWKDLSLVPDSKKFETITLWHVLEHVREPEVFLKSIKKIMAEDGQLIIEVPDVERYGSDIRPIHLDHIFHFSEKTLTLMAEKSGLKCKFVTRESKYLMDSLYGMVLIFSKKNDI